MKYLVNLDLNQNEIQNVVIQPLATAPASGVLGQIYYDTTDSHLYQYNGTNWVQVGIDSDATTSASGLMSATDKTKLNGIANGAEVNQNAFSNVVVGSTTIVADGKTDTLTLTAGSNVTLSPDATNDKVTIAATDTTYTSGTSNELSAGSVTDDRVWTPKILHDYVASAAGAADAMRFKGTIGTGGDITALPTTGVNIGDTYRVITAGTYASQTCEIGDLIIATATTPTWTVAQTNIDGAITSISGTSPISVTGSGNSRTVELEDSGVTAGTYDGGTSKGTGFYIPSITVDAKGRVISATDLGNLIPLVNSSSSAGQDCCLVTTFGYSIGLRSPASTFVSYILTAGSTTKTITLSTDLYSAYNYRTYFRVADVQAYDVITFEPVVVDWSTDKLESNGSSLTLTVSIASAHTNNISIFPILTYVSTSM